MKNSSFHRLGSHLRVAASLIFFFLPGTILASTWHLIGSFPIAMGEEDSSVGARAEVPSSLTIRGLFNAAA